MAKSVIILKGLPGSGKSTWARQMLNDYPGQYKRINKDDLRAMLDNSRWSKHNEKFVLNLRNHIILEALSDGRSVIVDDTNLSSRHEKTIKQLISKWNKDNQDNVEVQIVDQFLSIPLDKCIENDLKRPNSVGEKVIRDMYIKFLASQENIVPMVQDPALPHAIICDLDGTLCIHNNRSPFEYHKCDTDLLNENVSNLLFDFLRCGDRRSILFFSGREDSEDGTIFTKTLSWIKINLPWLKESEFSLHLRSHGDRRADYIVKKEMFENYVRNKYFVTCILDDRPQVIRECWHKLGLFVFNCQQGFKEF